MNNLEELQKNLKYLVTKEDKAGGVDESGKVSLKTNDIPAGVRKGFLKTINPSMPNGFIYEVYFPETKTTTYARLSAPLGVGWAPTGKFRNGIFYPEKEDCEVSLQMIRDSSKWEITGAADYDVEISPGATTVKRGEVVFEIRQDWVYINNKRVCVEPCHEKPQNA